MHDQIRGVNGNWNKAVDTIRRLRRIRAEFQNFGTHINHTISTFSAGNLGSLLSVLNNEEGLPTNGDDISVCIARTGVAFLKAGERNIEAIDEVARARASSDIDTLLASPMDIKGFTLAELRPVQKRIYNLLAKRYLQNPNRQVVPCAALFGSCYLDPFGNLYPCTVWEEARLGNLRSVNYDLKLLLSSNLAKEVSAKIRQAKCPSCWTGCESATSVFENSLTILPRMIVGKL
jgi:radical SAM protein with 4Fe4S-binding SPASM domain